MTRFITLFALLTLIAIVVSGCGRTNSVDYRARAISVGFKEIIHPGKNFDLLVLKRMQDPVGAVRIFIEGDGRAWVSRRRISNDPTPHNPVALRLALADRSENVIYIARPCQYIGAKSNLNCVKKFWTSHRFAPEVTGAILSAIHAQSDNRPIELVGFSGGAAVAVLLSGDLATLTSIRSIAGNLDIDELTRFHDVTPLTGSANPGDLLSRLRVPLMAYFGEEDRIIPPELGALFLRKAQGNRCIWRLDVPDATHGEGWVRFWHNGQDIAKSCR